MLCRRYVQFKLSNCSFGSIEKAKFILNNILEDKIKILFNLIINSLDLDRLTITKRNAMKPLAIYVKFFHPNNEKRNHKWSSMTKPR